jgi:hypothetical protein
MLLRFYAKVNKLIFALTQKKLMDRNLKNVTLGLILGIALISMLLFILPIDVVYKVPVTSKVYPAKEWSLIQNQSDYYTQTVIRSKEALEGSQNFVFDRGDIVNVHLAKDLCNGKIIEKDSAIIVFSSQMLNLRIQQAMNERAIQFSNLRAEQSAMKVPIFQEAQDNVERAKANLLLQSMNMGRMSRLFEEGVIAKLELDIQTNAQTVALQELKMAEKQLANTTFQGKPEDVEVYATMIGTAEKELQVLLNQEMAYEVKAPFRGRVTINPSEGVLLSISDIDAKTLIFPFPLTEKIALKNGASLVIEQNGQEFYYPFSLDNKAGMLAGKQFVLGSTDIDHSISSEYGEMITAYVSCDTLQIGDYILRKLRGHK